MKPDGRFKVLHAFRGGVDDGDGPLGLTRGPDGKLYGVTELGGTSNLGTAFRVDAKGQVTLLSSFVGGIGNPKDPLLAASDGQFYGISTVGNGAIFRMTTKGKITLVHAFQGGTSDGRGPRGRLIEGRDGLLYGTTLWGGMYCCGTVFQMSRSDGATTLLHHFERDGRSTNGPGRGVTESPDGWFYGVIGSKLGQNVDYRRGQIYRVKPDGQFEVVYDFPAPRHHGANPSSALLLGRDGHLYGTTAVTGNADGSKNDGTVFRFIPDSGLKTLHIFDRVTGDGYDPFTELVEANDGEFIGSTFYGLPGQPGVIFRLRATAR